MPSRGGETEVQILKRQLRSAQGNLEQFRRENNRLRQENARLALQAPMRDLLLANVRLTRATFETVQELLDKRNETIVIEHQHSPYIP